MSRRGDQYFFVCFVYFVARQLVTTALLGKAVIPDQAFENPDGTPLRIATDYFGKKRNEKNPFPGPFEFSDGGKQTVKVWETKESER